MPPIAVWWPTAPTPATSRSWPASAAAKISSWRELHLDRGGRAFPGECVDDRDRPEQDSGHVGEHEQRGERDPPARGALGRALNLLGDGPGDADRVDDDVRLHTQGARQQSEAGDEEERERQQEHEQPVGERAGEHAAADVGVPLDRLEGGIERRRALRAPPAPSLSAPARARPSAPGARAASASAAAARSARARRRRSGAAVIATRGVASPSRASSPTPARRPRTPATS